MAIRDKRSCIRRRLFVEEGAMKTERRFSGEIDPARVAVLLGLTVGLGIAVHESFFLIAGVIAIGAITAATVHAIHDHAEKARLAHQH